jgi:hypothetical protein
VTSVINRYYDPSTDQFISVDPDVGATDQPYIFAGDDPINSEDPLGNDPPMLYTSAQLAQFQAASELNYEESQLTNLEETVGAQVQADRLAWQQAISFGSKNWRTLQGKYLQALKNYAADIAPILSKSVDAYQAYSARADIAQAGQAYDELASTYQFLGSNSIEAADVAEQLQGAGEDLAAADIAGVGTALGFASSGDMFGFWIACLFGLCW